jgi:hypothetical protein
LRKRLKITSHLFYTQNFSIQCITIVKVAGSFRLAAGTSHLHEDFNFTELVLETVGQSLRHSCRTPIKCQGVSLPLDRQNYSRRLLRVSIKAKTFQFNLNSTGQASVSILLLMNLQRPVFLVYSRCP